jgi:hypothetical protein
MPPSDGRTYNCGWQSGLELKSSTFVSKLYTRQEINFLRHSSSPLKWTEILIQSYEDDFSYETVVLTTGGCCN